MERIKKNMKRFLSGLLLGIAATVLLATVAFAENRLGIELGADTSFYNNSPGTNLTGDRLSTSDFSWGVTGEWDFAPNWLLVGTYLWGAPGSFTLSSNQGGGTAATYSAAGASTSYGNFYLGWRFWNVGTGANSGTGNRGAAAAAIAGWQQSSIGLTAPFTLTAGTAPPAIASDYSFSAASWKVGLRGDIVVDPWYSYLELSWLPSVTTGGAYLTPISASGSITGAGVGVNVGTLYKLSSNWSLGLDYFFQYAGVNYQSSSGNFGVSHLDATTSLWAGSINYHW